ncbi:hypothetical protein JG687_00019171 [Phytophthora cactorum]|uniref:Uncharacterized protein n=1 Tax=Phytophthora cactorum TaxID=29920 RepID=A0A8T1TNM6_9STRA|nr:hypothetical protein JG687_00019171 [Phytophthora cactorum]
MECLYGTKRVSMDAFDKAMENAANNTYQWSDVETMTFRCTTRNFTMVKNIYESYHVSKEAIVRAFKRAAGLIRHKFCPYDDDRVQIVKLLYKEKCLSREVIGEAFVVAVGHRKTEVVELLRDDPRVRFDGICDAFAATTYPKTIGLLRFLYGKKWESSGAILRAFRKLAVCWRMHK